MTDIQPRTPPADAAMKTVIEGSYAARNVRELATVFRDLCDLIAPLIKAAALRELARLCEGIEATQRRIDEWRETTITGSMTMREPLTLLELIARGYRAAPEGERNG